MEKEEISAKQKALNSAFYASLAFPALSLFVVFLFTGFELSSFGYIELILFPTLGYFTKRSSRLAAIGLLGLFLLDRIVGLINWLSYILEGSTSQIMINIFFFLFWSFVFWQFFYKAYFYLKHE
jgi:hypothetical protein